MAIAKRAFATVAPILAGTTFLLSSSTAQAATSGCAALPDHKAVLAALTAVVESGNGGIFKPNMMWATLVDRSGSVCVVAKIGDAWPGSRVISAQKANTANAFSNDQLALSTANIFSAVQPGGSLFGLQHSNPVDADTAYDGNAARFGSAKDPLVGARIGGVNVFGGGLALYATGNKSVLGGIGVSGDTSCSDHIIAWLMRERLGLGHVPGGVSAAKDDNIIHDIDASGKSAGGFGHPVCSADTTKLAGALRTPNSK